MKCPTCVDIDLVMTERQNVEIDYCPKCRGVWLDRGELDKIIEKSLGLPPQPAASQPSADPNVGGHAQQGPYGGHAQQGHHGGYGKQGYRRKSWLSEIFD